MTRLSLDRELRVRGGNIQIPSDYPRPERERGRDHQQSGYPVCVCTLYTSEVAPELFTVVICKHTYGHTSKSTWRLRACFVKKHVHVPTHMHMEYMD